MPRKPAKPLTILDLHSGMCRWPSGDRGAWTYCGAPIALGSYCRTHAEIAHPAGRVADEAAWARKTARVPA